ncbi:extracellular solute-binding protein [Paenibacillus sp. UNCCL117]|uniref:extracellular solute-binding protein n=1 Tax=unclassified Paenibacillus TaxID=185978 RepID=UPI000880D356|nr:MULTISPECIES: extracellular solute-binding protein [unclassified Paenibacillus]SDE65145.1 extracellular solute-binding protein [Paenibacillus sp. cl123]SFW70482.1 extracellular solute-binding protein [Paenibacillus sp. UNCCL117]
MLRRPLPILMTGVIASTVLYGCSDGTKGPAAPEGGQGAEAGPLPKITVIKPLYPGHVYYPDSGLEKLVEKGAHVDVTYETPPSAEYKTTINVKLAGGDIPDIVNTFSPGDAEHNALIAQGVFLPLDDLLPKFPKLKAAFSDNIWNMMKSPTDGKIYGVPWLRDRGGTGLIIRKDWLEKLGLSDPKTLDELVEVMRAFRDKDPDGNGQKDTIPFAFKDNQLTNVYALLPLFGGNPGWYPDAKDASKLLNGTTQPEVKDMFTFLRQLRQEELLDPDFMVGKTIGFDKFKSGKVGIIATNIGDFRQLAIIPAMKAEILDPIEHKGRKWQLALPALPISRTNQISSKSKNPEAALRYLEYQLTDGYDYIQYGAEGKTYSIENGIKTPFPDDKKDKQYNTNVGLELLQPEWLFTHTEKYTKFVSKDIAQYMIKKLDEYEKYAVYDYLRPNVEFPYRSETSAQLGQILTEGYSKMLLDAKVDPNQIFDETMAKWKSSGGDKMIEEVNRLQKNKSAPSYSYMKKS